MTAVSQINAVAIVWPRESRRGGAVHIQMLRVGECVRECVRECLCWLVGFCIQFSG